MDTFAVKRQRTDAESVETPHYSQFKYTQFITCAVNAESDPLATFMFKSSKTQDAFETFFRDASNTLDDTMVRIDVDPSNGVEVRFDDPGLTRIAQLVVASEHVSVDAAGAQKASVFALAASLYRAITTCAQGESHPVRFRICKTHLWIDGQHGQSCVPLVQGKEVRALPCDPVRDTTPLAELPSHTLSCPSAKNVCIAYDPPQAVLHVTYCSSAGDFYVARDVSCAVHPDVPQGKWHFKASTFFESVCMVGGGHGTGNTVKLRCRIGDEPQSVLCVTGEVYGCHMAVWMSALGQ